MIKKLKDLLSRLSSVAVLKTSRHRKIVVGLKRPHLHKWDKTALIEMAKTPAWQKLRLTAHAEICSLILVNGLADEFRRGWLECFAFLDDTIKGLASEEDIEKIDDQEMTISMQGLEEDGTDF